MYTRSEDCPVRHSQIQKGNGIIHLKDLTDQKSMYDHARLFSHITIDPGCSIGYHPHINETEFYYMLKGEAVFNDNGQEEIVVRPGDVCATGYGQHHSLENRSQEPVELIALIVLDN